MIDLTHNFVETRPQDVNVIFSNFEVTIASPQGHDPTYTEEVIQEIIISNIEEIYDANVFLEHVFYSLGPRSRRCSSLTEHDSHSMH